MKFFRAALLAAVFLSHSLPIAFADSVIPKAADGRSLNLGFEAGDLRDWQATGKACLNSLKIWDMILQTQKKQI